MQDDEKDIEIEAEDTESPMVGGDPVAKVKKLKEEIEKLRIDKQEYLDGWQRSKADYVNLLKRSEQGSKEAQIKGVVKAVETLLPAFDALERAREHGEVPEGFAGIAKQLEGAFASLGLEELGTVGEKFDPALHEALGQDAAASQAEDDTITAVLEKGWRIGDPSTGSGQGIIVRPAKIRVAHFA